MLPDSDGFEVCRNVRTRSQTPILMLTARGEEMDRIVGLEIGADDYLAKPFSPREPWLAFAQFSGADASRFAPRMRSYGSVGFRSIAADRRMVRIDGEERMLTSYQFDSARRPRRQCGSGAQPRAADRFVKGEASSKPSTARSTFTSRASDPSSRTIQSIRAESSRFAAPAMSSPKGKIATHDDRLSPPAVLEGLSGAAAEPDNRRRAGRGVDVADRRNSPRAPGPRPPPSRGPGGS